MDWLYLLVLLLNDQGIVENELLLSLMWFDYAAIVI